MAFWNKKQEKPSIVVTDDEVRQQVTNNLDLYVNAVNDTLRGRAISGGYDNADTLHNIFYDFGYPTELTFQNFWNMYRRFGIARNGVDLPVDASWMTQPEIKGSLQFDNELKKLTDRINLYHRIRGLDMRQRVGRYAGVFMRVRDGLTPDQPLDKMLPGSGALVSMIPLNEGQLEVLTVNNDPMSDDYGMPTLYQFNGSAAGNRNDKMAVSFTIHPSRLIIAAEGADDGSIYGIPALEAGYNSLMDLRKIIGAGGEGFYKNAAQTVVFNLKDAASAKQNEALLTKFNENYDEFARNRARRAMWTPGLEANALTSTLANPQEFFMSALNDFAASVKIPATILIGQQTGRLASSEDSRSFLSMINSRRENFCTEMIYSVVDWCIKNGILPASDYEVEWDDLLALSDNEKLDNAAKMAEINKSQFASGGSVPFSGEDVREQAGYEVEDMPEDDGEEIPVVEPITEPATDGI